MKLSNLLFTIAFLFLWMETSCLPPKFGCRHTKGGCVTLKNNSTTRPGVCPKPRVLHNSSSPCDNKCSNDSICPELMKCCDSGCGLKCDYAERSGFCPNNDLPAEGGTIKKPCLGDFSCKGHTKCCDRGSTRDCLPLLKEKPGVCPDVCESTSGQPCSSDHDCSENLKCCSNCGKKCTVPKIVKHAVPLK